MRYDVPKPVGTLVYANSPDQFDAGYRESMLPPEARESRVNAGALAQKLLDEYKEAANARELVNLRWMLDLQQYKGQYDFRTISHLRKTKRSSVYYRLTTAKVNTMVARLMDLLFPQRSKNWSITNTPDPMLPDEVIMEALSEEITTAAQSMYDEWAQRLAAENIMPDQLADQKMRVAAVQEAFQQANTPEARIRIARDRAAAMEQVIDDQLKEVSTTGLQRPSWQSNCKEVVKAACLYGMGVMKGPLVERVQTKRFVRTDEAKWEEQVYSEDLRPYHEAVSLWSVFPDPDAMKPQDLRYVWQIHLKSDKDMLELANFPGFDGQAIRAYMALHNEGDASLETWESHLHTLDETSLRTDKLAHRYRVYERWGFLSGKDLFDAGLDDIAEDDYATVYSSNV